MPRGPAEAQSTAPPFAPSLRSHQARTPVDHSVKRQPNAHQEGPPQAVDVYTDALFWTVRANADDQQQYQGHQKIRNHVERVKKEDRPDDRCMRVSLPVEIETAPFQVAKKEKQGRQ